MAPVKAIAATVLATIALIAPAETRAEESGMSWAAVQTNLSPTATAQATVSGQQATLDGSGSTDPDGDVASGTWDFGDGVIAQGLTAAHTYQRNGAYIAHLTIRDDGGAIDSTPVFVQIGPPPQTMTEDVNVPTRAGYTVHARVTRPADAAQHPVVVRYSLYCVSYTMSDDALVRSGYVFIAAEAPGVCASGGG